jgi:hypothetical protein
LSCSSKIPLVKRKRSGNHRQVCKPHAFILGTKMARLVIIANFIYVFRYDHRLPDGFTDLAARA